MMRRRIRLTDHLGRDATVWMVPCRPRIFRRYRSESGEDVRSVQRMKATSTTHPESLMSRYVDPTDFARALITLDPEIDIERTGRMVEFSERVWVDGEGNPIYVPKMEEVRKDRSGQAIERRPRRVRHGNLLPHAAPVWSGVLMPRQAVVTRYELAQAWQLMHGNTLEFDFLWGLTQWLDQQGCMALVGRGATGRDPLIMHRGAKPCLGFLDGRIFGEGMRLVLYLARGELGHKGPRGNHGED